MRSWPTRRPWQASSGAARDGRRSAKLSSMKILVANPNTSTGVTDRLVASGKLVASAGTELIPMTAPRGVPYIATRAEAAIGSAVMLEMLAEKRGTFDAAICAAFGDPGLGGARELF